MSNIPLFVLDIILLPFTLLRVVFIYMLGSRYGINRLDFLDVMMHAKNKYFNRCNESTLDIDDIDIKVSIRDGCNAIAKDTYMHLDKSTELPPVTIESTAKLNVQDLMSDDEIDNESDSESTQSSGIEDNIDKQTEKFIKELER